MKPELDVVFRGRAGELEQPDVLELGTLRWGTEPTSVGASWVPRGTLVRSDVTDGVDVDVAADAHDLEPFADESFDVYIARSVYEHLSRPWLAAHAAARVMRSGAWLYVSTHQTFPLHGYPHDYWRFSAQALELIFVDAGLVEVTAGYTGPCKIVPNQPVDPWNTVAEAWLNVHVIAKKP